MLNTEQVEETIKDVEVLKAKIIERHKSDVTFCLRTESVFNQFINSLSYVTGTIVGQGSSFVPQPLKSVIGKTINTKSSAKLVLESIKIDEEESFREIINSLHETFLDRDNIALLDSLKDIEIRGVAKVAGLEDFKTAKIDGAYIDSIKEKIVANANLEIEKEKARLALNNTDNVKTNDDATTPAIKTEAANAKVESPVVGGENANTTSINTKKK